MTHNKFDHYLSYNLKENIIANKHKQLIGENHQRKHVLHKFRKNAAGIDSDVKEIFVAIAHDKNEKNVRLER